MSTWALLAQGIERLPPEQKAAGSNPVEGTISQMFQLWWNKKEEPCGVLLFYSYGAPNGNRTRVSALKGPRPDL